MYKTIYRGMIWAGYQLDLSKILNAFACGTGFKSARRWNSTLTLSVVSFKIGRSWENCVKCDSWFAMYLSTRATNDRVCILLNNN